MKSTIYNYSRKFFLTAELTRKIESRISILYPSTRYSIIQRTAEYLIRVYIVAVLVIIGLFICADFSLYYAMMSAVVAYVVISGKIYGDLDKLELKLLGQLEKFVSDVKFRFQFDGMLEEAIQDVVNYAEYEMAIQGERLLECLKNYYRGDGDDYGEISPNHYFLTFYSICYMVLKYGDKKVDGQSMFVKNLGYLKEDINIEQLKRRKIHNEFMGLLGLTILPVFSVKPIERWAISNMPEMRAVYSGVEGIVTTILIVFFTVLVYKLILSLRRINYDVKYKNQLIGQIAQNEMVRKFLLFQIIKLKKRAEKMNRLLKEVVYEYDLLEFMLMRWMMCTGYLILGVFLFGSIGIRGIWLCLISMLCGMSGYYQLYFSVIVKKQILIMEREEEIVRFQTIILMIMHIDRMTIAEILQHMELFAVSFKNEIYELSNELSNKGMDTFREAKGKTGFHPYEKLLDSFLACDTMPIFQAFEDVETDRGYYVEKHKQDNEEIINKKSMIAKTIAFLPLCLVILLKLILPFVMQGISALGNSMIS